MMHLALQNIAEPPKKLHINKNALKCVYLLFKCQVNIFSFLICLKATQNLVAFSNAKSQ